MKFCASEIVKATRGHFLEEPAEDVPVEKISTDTRMLGKNDAFFALQGARFDGHDFIGDAVAKGVRVLVVSKKESVRPEFRKSAVFVMVKDTLKAYGDLAAAYRQRFKIPAVVVTGSCGKTTVKEILTHLLSSHFAVLKNRGTENNRVGVPKTIFGLEPFHEMLVMEMGTSVPGEIEILSSIVRPQMAILTQIGPSHLEGFKTPEGVLKEKTEVLRNLERGGILILNGEDSYLRGVSSGVHKVSRVGYTKETGDTFADKFWCHDKGTSFYLNGKDLFETQLIGRHNILNCLLALSAASAFGINLESLRKNLAAFRPIGGRLNFRPLDGIQFIDDTYNSNPVSFKAALETLKSYKIRERKGVICGDMLELGEQAEGLHRSMGSLVAELLFDYVITTGPLSSHLADQALRDGFDPRKIFQAKDSLEAGAICRRIATTGDMVLVKGSRGMQMDRVFECFITS